jgi:thiamine-phosphate pyrophosphorylase
MFNKKNLTAFYFVDQINESIISIISEFKNISLIYQNKNNSLFNLPDLTNIKKFCNKNNIKFYVTDNIRLAIKIGANGIYLTKDYNRMLHNFNYKKEFTILGSVHNQLEYFKKNNQKCKKFFLSPIFYNKKYSINRILGVLKFKLISKDWKNDVIPLAGINHKNVKRIALVNRKFFAFGSWKKKPT